MPLKNSEFKSMLLSCLEDPEIQDAYVRIYEKCKAGSTERSYYEESGEHEQEEDRTESEE